MVKSSAGTPLPPKPRRKKGHYTPISPEKLPGPQEQYGCQDVCDGAKLDLIYLVDFRGFDWNYLGGRVGGNRGNGRAWDSSASAKIGNVPLTYCQYRNGLVGQDGPMERGIASALSGKTFMVQGS
jgi:hypothetical protein